MDEDVKVEIIIPASWYGKIKQEASNDGIDVEEKIFNLIIFSLNQKYSSDHQEPDELGD